jgi:hypothetical protein
MVGEVGDELQVPAECLDVAGDGLVGQPGRGRLVVRRLGLVRRCQYPEWWNCSSET